MQNRNRILIKEAIRWSWFLSDLFTVIKNNKYNEWHNTYTKQDLWEVSVSCLEKSFKCLSNDT